MKYVVYCDESRHDGEGHSYMAIGGLWVPAAQKANISHSFRNLCRELDLNAEVKWSKTSTARLANYQSLVDFFFNTPELQFRVIVVNHGMVDHDRFHDGDRELAFYKFYYQMLKAWLLKGNEYLLLLDRKQNRHAKRYEDLRKILNRRALLAGAKISDLTTVNSRETPLAQLCDLLTGAVAAAACADLHGAKLSLAQSIARSAGFKTLNRGSVSPDMCKFNIFRIRLRAN